VLYAQVRDQAGNESAVYSVQTTVDSLAPTGGVTIRSILPLEALVQLELEAYDAVSGVEMMLLAYSANWEKAQWQSYVNSVTIPLVWSENTIMAIYRDRAGNTSEIYSVSLARYHLIFLPVVANRR
jgi:hypothetical protein